MILLGHYEDQHKTRTSNKSHFFAGIKDLVGWYTNMICVNPKDLN